MPSTVLPARRRPQMAQPQKKKAAASAAGRTTKSRTRKTIKTMMPAPRLPLESTTPLLMLPPELQAPGAIVGLDKPNAEQEQEPTPRQSLPLLVKQPGEQPLHVEVVPVQEGSEQMASLLLSAPLAAQVDAFVWQPLLLHIAHPEAARHAPQFRPVQDCCAAANGASTARSTRKRFAIVLPA